MFANAPAFRVQRGLANPRPTCEELAQGSPAAFLNVRNLASGTRNAENLPRFLCSGNILPERFGNIDDLLHRLKRAPEDFVFVRASPKLVFYADTHQMP